MIDFLWRIPVTRPCWPCALVVALIALTIFLVHRFVA